MDVQQNNLIRRCEVIQMRCNVFLINFNANQGEIKNIEEQLKVPTSGKTT